MWRPDEKPSNLLAGSTKWPLDVCFKPFLGFVDGGEQILETGGIFHRP